MKTALFNKEIPFFIKEQLKEVGLSTPIRFMDEHNNEMVPYSQLITYAYAFDFLFGKGYLVSVSKDYSLAEECFSGAFDWSVDGSTTKDSDAGFADTCFYASNKAILKTIELIQKKEEGK